MSYRITLGVLGPLASGCRPPAGIASTPCQQPGFYTVSIQTDNGIGSGGNVCPEHLFPTIGHYLGLPASPQDQQVSQLRADLQATNRRLDDLIGALETRVARNLAR